jgi:succinate dehydrogenase/fumarate reductase flavoprotein subunit
MFHGHKLMDGMRKKVLDMGVELKERIMVTDLLVNQRAPAYPNRVAGLIGRHARTGEWIVIHAGALVLACGPIFFKDGGGYVDNINGDGVAMAYRAGASLTGMEFATRCNIIIWRRGCKASGINMFQGHGAHIVNAKGERFMERYDPILKERPKTFILGAAFTKEALEGRGPIYVDMRHLTSEVFEKFARVIPKTIQVFSAAGIDPKRELIECAPSVHTPHSSSGEGGIKVDINCRTNLPGLFAAGGATKLKPHGTYAVGGLNLAYCCVSGYRAGYGASQFAQGSLRPPLPGDGLLTDYIDEQQRYFTGDRIDLEEIIREIKLVTVPAKYSFFKHRWRINETLARLEEIEAALLPQAKVDGIHNWVKGMEIKNYLSCAQLVYKAALLREESRGSLFREEFPSRDDRNWLKWITMQRIGPKDRVIIEPIPLDRYPIKPKSLEPVPFPVQYYFQK